MCDRSRNCRKIQVQSSMKQDELFNILFQRLRTFWCNPALFTTVWRPDIIHNEKELAWIYNTNLIAFDKKKNPKRNKTCLSPLFFVHWRNVTQTNRTIIHLKWEKFAGECRRTGLHWGTDWFCHSWLMSKLSSARIWELGGGFTLRVSGSPVNTLTDTSALAYQCFT